MSEQSAGNTTNDSGHVGTDHRKRHGVHERAADLHASVSDDPVRKAYEAAQMAYQKELGDYWKTVEASKSAHKIVTQFPPFYNGPAKPANYDPPKEPSKLPSVNDMLHAWNILAPLASGHQKNPNFPGLKIEESSESEFKRTYARESLIVGKKYGLSKSETQNIVQNIYAFEDAGNGTADLLSGVPFRYTAPDAPGSHANRDKRREIHPASTAIGYNQLLMATSAQFIDQSNAIGERLDEMAKSEPGRRDRLLAKEKLFAEVRGVLHGELIKFAENDKTKYFDNRGHLTYALYTDFARSMDVTKTGLTGRQMTSAVQALNLDRDVGPILQARELDELFGHGLDPAFKSLLNAKSQDDMAAAKNYQHLPGPVKAAAVQSLIDRVVPRSHAGSAAATDPANILHAHLLAFSTDPTTPLTRAVLGEPAYELLMNKVIPAKKYGAVTGPLTAESRALLDALFVKVMNHPSAEDYLPAAVELGNLAGTANADEMLKGKNAAYPTVNYFDRRGYQSNGIVNGLSADELVKAIYRNMHGNNGSPQNYGMADMIKAFESQSVKSFK